MHIHTLILDIPHSKNVTCEGCDVKLRLATHDEAWYVHATGEVAENGPIIWESNIVVVPLDYTIFKEA